MHARISQFIIDFPLNPEFSGLLLFAANQSQIGGNQAASEDVIKYFY